MMCRESCIPAALTHFTAWRRYAGHGLMSIGLLSTGSEHLAARTRKLALAMHQKLTADLDSLEFVKASTQLVAELQT